jgi:hypothetical protein
MSYSLNEIRSIAPSVFTTDKAPHLTDKYIQTPTSRVVEDLMALGWEVMGLGSTDAFTVLISSSR